MPVKWLGCCRRLDKLDIGDIQLRSATVRPHTHNRTRRHTWQSADYGGSSQQSMSLWFLGLQVAATLRRWRWMPLLLHLVTPSWDRNYSSGLAEAVCCMASMITWSAWPVTTWRFSRNNSKTSAVKFYRYVEIIITNNSSAFHHEIFPKFI